MPRNNNNDTTVATTTTSMVNAGPFVAAVQDSHSLWIDADILTMLVTRFNSALKRGDPTDMDACIKGIAAHIYHAGVMLKTLAPEQVSSWPSEDTNVRRLLQQDTGEHSYSQ